MEIDKVVRRCRPALGATALPLRRREDCIRLVDSDIAGERIMLDTCVIIDQMKGQLPEDVEARVLARTVVHSPIVIGEMSYLIGRLDPQHPDTGGVTAAIKTLLASIPDHRILPLTPEDTVCGNILAGCLSRILNYDQANRRRVQNDAIVASQASRLGCLLVTNNFADFDRLSQLDPKLRVAFY